MGESSKKDAQKPSFFKTVKAEFGKITWPDMQGTYRQSIAVLCISIILGLIITFMDTLIQFGVNFITSL